MAPPHRPSGSSGCDTSFQSGAQWSPCLMLFLRLHPLLPIAPSSFYSPPSPIPVFNISLLFSFIWLFLFLLNGCMFLALKKPSTSTIPSFPFLTARRPLLSGVMIISYLARIVLLLPELSSGDTDRLAEIAANQVREQFKVLELKNAECYPPSTRCLFLHCFRKSPYCSLPIFQ